MLPSSLPVALDSFGFFNGGQTEEKHVLFTDNFVMNDDESLNHFSIGPLSKGDTIVRIYVEDSAIGIELTCTGPKDPKKKSPPTSAGAFIQADIPENGSCKFSLFHASKELLNRKVFLTEKVRVTVLVADWKFVKKNYHEHHYQGLAECKTN